ncbi:hypothetical protein DEH69_15240 [Streptomyces sp. PT12]|nr:hypothetical protein DEH69_15240 [Streptomyces sp. PT12]
MVGADSMFCRAHPHAAGSARPGHRSEEGTRPRRQRPGDGSERSRGGVTCMLHIADEGGCSRMALLLTPSQ